MPSSCRCGLPSFGLSGCYHCLKGRVDWTAHPPEPDGLDETERAFIGIFPPRPSDRWTSPDSIPALASMADDDGQPWMTDAEQRLLQVLADMPARGWGGDPDEGERSHEAEAR